MPTGAPTSLARLAASTCLVLGIASASPAQTPPPAAPPTATTPPPAVDADSPRAAFRAFQEAAHTERWEEAARLLPPGGDANARLEQARKLSAVIDSLFELDPDSISGDAAGRMDDGLPPDIEHIAQVERADPPGPLRMVRGTADGRSGWTFTPATAGRIDGWYDGLYSRWIRERLATAGLHVLLREGPLDTPYWQWLAFPLLALIAALAGWIVHRLAKPIVERLTRRTASPWDDRFFASLGPPFSLAFGLIVFATGTVLTDLGRDSYRLIGDIVRPTMTFAFFWAIWRVSAVVLAWSMSASWALNSASARNLLSIGTNLSRGVIVVLGVLAMLAAAGFHVGTALAGLGIGGLALAFGSQKAVENLFGSIALAMDQPIRVGDFVKVQDFVGTVEEIGIRSTRIRTLDRTLISLPNGKLADERLESFAVRDRMRLATTVALTYATTRRQMEEVLAGIEHVLRSHPRIWPDSVVVKFKELGASSLDIEVMAWFSVPDWGQFQACRQDVLLGFMEVVERAGASMAFPTRTVHLVTERGETARSGVDGHLVEQRTKG